MNTSVTITSMLDEEDNTPVFEVKDESGNATNCTTIEQALDMARQAIIPAKSLEQLATEWVKAHGTVWYDNNGEEFCEEMEVTLTEDQLDIVARLVQSATVVVKFY